MILKNLSAALLLLTIAFTFPLLTIPSHAATLPLTLKIDGNAGDINWQHGRAIEAFQTLDGKTPKATTTGKILTDANYLYLAFHCQEPQMNKLQDALKSRDGNLWTNDCIEIFVAPFADSHQFFHLIVDVNGQVYDALNSNGKEDSNYDLSIIAKTRRQQNRWTLEMAIPLSDLGLNQARQALMNFGRERKPESKLSSWHGAFAKPDTWQQVKLTLNQQHIVDVQKWNFGGVSPQYGDNTAGINFTSAKTASLKVLLYAYQYNGWVLKNSKTIQTVPEKEISVSFPYSLLPRDKPQKIQFVIDNKNESIFSVTYQLNLPDNALAANLRSPYYYSDEVYGFAQLQTFLSPSSLKKSSVRLIVKNPQGELVQRKKIYPLQPSMTIGFDISSWSKGDGAIFAELLLDGKTLAHQRLIINKRPGPFSKSTFDDNFETH